MNTTHVSSFVLISILRGQPRTPPSGDNLGVLDYHLKPFFCIFGLVLWCAVVLHGTPLKVVVKDTPLPPQ